MQITKAHLRQIIREALLEDLAGFMDRTKDIDYMHTMDDPTFDDPYYKDSPYKTLSGWNVGWALNDLLSLSRNNEIATMGYLPGEGRVTSSWGKAGVIVQGRVTLAANDMEAITSGYFKEVPDEVISKYKSSGIPRRALTFNNLKSGEYILDRASFNPEMSRHNEFIVDNWKPVGVVIAYERQEFLDAIRKAPRPKEGNPPGPLLEYTRAVLQPELPIYDEDMKLVDREEIERALQEKSG
jgi:hypothetical protein